MKIIFAGTPDFALTILKELYKYHQIVAVFTQIDRKKGRGRKLRTSVVKDFTLSNNLNLYQAQSINTAKVVDIIKHLQADVMVVASYGLLLPKTILNITKYGCINVHGSILPKWRGAAPIERAILANDKKTGISIMKMDAGLDTGDVFFTTECVINDNDTAQTLRDKLAILGAKTIIETLNNIDILKMKPQTGITSYAHKLNKNEAWINWNHNMKYIQRQIRAFNPYPIAQTLASSDKFDKKVLRILSADIVNNNGDKGEIIINKNSVVINGDKDALSLNVVQLAGKKAIKIKDFNNAYKLKSVFNKN